jgi:predicted nucleic acid-binding protein
MKVYVLDANAALRYLVNGPGGDKVETLIDRAAKGEIKVFMSVVNWGEALYTLARTTGFTQATADLRSLGLAIEFMPANQAQAEVAAGIKLRYKLGYADCYAATLAIQLSATLVTADPEFAKLGKQIRILALPPHAS